MKIIPVLDLKGGIVVHARQGLRKNYQAIQSRLHPNSRAEDFIKIFINDFSIDTIYIADLDAITNTGDNFHYIQTLLKRFPSIQFYLDAGISLFKQSILDFNQCRPIIGTETHFNIETLINIKEQYENLILSLDFKDDAFWGIKDILETPAIWPDDVIVMNLDQVGTQQELPLQRLEYIQSLNHKKRIFFAGGIRNIYDLKILQKKGVYAALLATALHNGSITKENIKLLQAKKYPA